MSDAWTGFRRFWRLTRKQATSKPQQLWPEMWEHVSDASKQKKKKRTIGKLQLDDARRLRGIYFIDPDDKEFKLTMKAARSRLEIPMPAAMPR